MANVKTGVDPLTKETEKRISSNGKRERGTAPVLLHARASMTDPSETADNKRDVRQRTESSNWMAAKRTNESEVILFN